MTRVPLTVFSQDLHSLPHSLGKYFKRRIILKKSRSCGRDVSVHRSHLLDSVRNDSFPFSKQCAVKNNSGCERRKGERGSNCQVS